MVQAATNSVDQKALSGTFEIDSSTISIKMRPDAETIHKTKEIYGEAPVTLAASQFEDSPSLEGRVTPGGVPLKEIEQPVPAAEVPVAKEIDPENSEMAADPLEPITLSHPAADPEYLRAVDQELGRLQEKATPEEVNFLIKIREVIGKILAQFSEISEKDRFQMEEMKLKYRRSSQDAADLQRSLGNAGLWIAGIGFAVLLSQFGFKNPADREVMKFLSEQCPNIGGMFTSRYQANQKEADALSQLMLAEYNAKTSKSQSESSSKQEVVNLLDKALESMKRAASAA